MFYIRMKKRNLGSSGRGRLYKSNENYNTMEDAARALFDAVEEQKKQTYWQLGGMVRFDERFINNGHVLEIIPALNTMRGLELTFTIEKEGD